MAVERPGARRLRLVHRISYRFERPVLAPEILLRLTPRSLDRQKVEHHQIVVDPPPSGRRDDEDAHGNACALLRFAASLPALEVTAVSTLLWPERPRRAAAEEALARDVLARAGVLAVPVPGAPVLRSEGACRRQAESALDRLRAEGVACRYMAGYALPGELATRPDAPRRTGGKRRAHSSPHAWLSFALPGGRWVDFDPTLAMLDPPHPILGWGSCYGDVAPVSGVLTARGRYRLTSSVTVERLER